MQFSWQPNKCYRCEIRAASFGTDDCMEIYIVWALFNENFQNWFYRLLVRKMGLFEFTKPQTLWISNNGTFSTKLAHRNRDAVVFHGIRRDLIRRWSPLEATTRIRSAPKSTSLNMSKDSGNGSELIQWFLRRILFMIYRLRPISAAHIICLLLPPNMSKFFS